jgi:gas vesicle protein
MYEAEYTQGRQSSRDFLTGAMVGIAVGTVVGLFMATKPGTELRDQVAESARKFKRQVGETYDQAADAVSNAVDRGRDALRKGREKFDEARQEYAPDDFRADQTPGGRVS